jgi:hypothetical protein
MEAQKSIKEFNYLFRGNLNSPIVTTSIIFIIPLTMVLIGLSMSFEKYGRFFSISLIISMVIYFFVKFDDESNLILFTTEGLIHYKKKSLDKFSYSEINKIEIIIQTRRQPLVHMKLRGKEFAFSLDKKNYSNFTYTEFAEHLLNIDSNILIIENVSTKKYRYSIKNGEILKTQI